MPIWQLCANLLIPNCLRSNLSYSPLAALELYVNMRNKKCLLLNRIGIFLSMIMLEGLMIRHDYLLASESLSYNEINLIKQSSEVKGQVVDVNGEPIIGASVKIKNTSLGTITDLNGFFILKDESAKNLIISFIGYETKEVALKGQTFVKVVFRKFLSSVPQ